MMVPVDKPIIMRGLTRKLKMENCLKCPKIKKGVEITKIGIISSTLLEYSEVGIYVGMYHTR